jgi:hypothetical protein
MAGRVVVRLPFEGLWLTQNSPARRVPSHGTDLLGSRYAIDFVGVDQRHKTAPSRSWRTLVGTEPPELFVAYGRPLLAPAEGVVVKAHDGEADHEARRSQLTLVPYMLGQASRYRQGIAAIAGNYIVIGMGGAFVALAHLRRGSLRVAEGERVTAGQPVAECGNSGNSTQPHVHLQVMDDPDLAVARGVPMEFRRFREWNRGKPQLKESGLPAEQAIVEPLAR